MVLSKIQRRSPLSEHGRMGNGLSRLLSFLTPLAILLLVYVLFGMFPFGQKSLLITDMSQIYVDFHSWFYDVLKGGDNFLFSWNTGLGMNMVGVLTFYLSSPFSFLILLFERSQIPDAILLITLLKVGSCGLTFSFYSSKALRFNGIRNVIFSSMYALTTYVVVYALNIMWLDGIIMLPLVLLGVHSLVEKGRILPLTVSFLVAFITQFYIAYMIGVFSVFYFLGLMFHVKRPAWKTLGNRLGKFVLSGALGGFMSAFLLLPTYLSLQYVYLYISTSNPGAHTLTPIELISKMALGSYDTLTYGLPNLFCGTLCILLGILYFLNRSIPKREKIISGSMLLILLLSMTFWPLNMFWHAFDEPTWFPYRFSFLYCFVLLVLSIRCFQRLDGLKGWHIAAAAGGGSICFGSVLLFGMEHITAMQIGTTVALLCVYALLIAAMRYRPQAALAMTLVLAATVVVELYDNTSKMVSAMDTEFGYNDRASYVGFVENRSGVIQSIRQQDRSWYRMENHDMRNANDSLSLDYYGMAHYDSFTNQHMSQFLCYLCVTTTVQNRFLRYYGSTSALDSLLGIKYVLGTTERRNGYREIQTFGNDQKVFLNENALSIGYMVDDDLKHFTYYPDSQKDPFYLQNKLLSAIDGQEYDYYTPIYKVVTQTAENISVEPYNYWWNSVSKNENNGNSYISYTIVNPKAQNVCFYLPSIGLPEQNCVYVNGELYGPWGYDLIGAMDLGWWEAGQEITVSFELRKDSCYLGEPQFYGFDGHAADLLFDRLKEHQMTDIEMGTASVKGTVDAGEGGLLFTSIPSDPGWSVKVDGETVQPVNIADAFWAVELPEGQHEVCFSFMPQGFRIGVILSIAALLLAVILVYRIDYKGTRKKKEIPLDKTENPVS